MFNPFRILLSIYIGLMAHERKQQELYQLQSQSLQQLKLEHSGCFHISDLTPDVPLEHRCRVSSIPCLISVSVILAAPMHFAC
jgi:hypothetical protein